MAVIIKLIVIVLIVVPSTKRNFHSHASTTHQECLAEDTVGERIDGNLTASPFGGYLMKDYVIDCCGKLTTWEYYGMASGLIQLQVWNPVDPDNNLYQLRGKRDVFSFGVSMKSVDLGELSIAVRPGDVIGWRTSSAAMIGYISGNGENSQNYFQPNMEGVIPGENFTFPPVPILNRTYSIYGHLEKASPPTFENLPSNISLLNYSSGDVIFSVAAKAKFLSISETLEFRIWNTDQVQHITINKQTGEIIVVDELPIGYMTIFIDVIHPCGVSSRSTLTIHITVTNPAIGFEIPSAEMVDSDTSDKTIELSSSLLPRGATEKSLWNITDDSNAIQPTQFVSVDTSYYRFSSSVTNVGAESTISITLSESVSSHISSMGVYPHTEVLDTWAATLHFSEASFIVNSKSTAYETPSLPSVIGEPPLLLQSSVPLVRMSSSKTFGETEATTSVVNEEQKNIMVTTTSISEDRISITRVQTLFTEVSSLSNSVISDSLSTPESITTTSATSEGSQSTVSQQTLSPYVSSLLFCGIGAAGGIGIVATAVIIVFLVKKGMRKRARVGISNNKSTDTSEARIIRNKIHEPDPDYCKITNVDREQKRNINYKR